MRTVTDGTNDGFGNPLCYVDASSRSDAAESEGHQGYQRHRRRPHILARRSLVSSSPPGCRRAGSDLPGISDQLSATGWQGLDQTQT